MLVALTAFLLSQLDDFALVPADFGHTLAGQLSAAIVVGSYLAHVTSTSPQATVVDDDWNVLGIGFCDDVN